MILDLRLPVDRQKLKSYSDYLLSREVVIEIKERKHQRSSSQNAYLHVLLSYFAAEFGFDLETVKYDLFKKTVNNEIFSRVRKNKQGRDVTYIRSTRDLDTGEMTTAIERFRHWSVQTAGLYLPAPNEEDALLEAEKQIELCKQYL